jgi:hypothetical protein
LRSEVSFRFLGIAASRYLPVIPAAFGQFWHHWHQ